MKSLSAAKEKKRLRTVGFGELADNPDLLAPPEPMGKFGLFYPHQITMLAAREKMGKSSLASSEVVSVARNGYRVLWISRDEGIDHMIRRVSALVGDDWPVDHNGDELIRTTEDWPESWRDLTDLVWQEQPDCVLVDSLSSVSTALGIGIPETSKGEEWHALVNAYRAWGRPVCILHHATKPHEGRPSGYRGSTGIGAAVDMIITMDGKEGDTHRQLKRAGRWVLPTLLLDWDGEDGGYRTLSVSEEVLTKSAKAKLWLWPEDIDGADPSACASLRDVEMQIAELTGAKESSLRSARQRMAKNDPAKHLRLLEQWGLSDEE